MHPFLLKLDNIIFMVNDFQNCFLFDFFRIQTKLVIQYYVKEFPMIKHLVKTIQVTSFESTLKSWLFF